MKTKVGIILAAVAALVASVIVAIQPAYAATGIRISNGRLVEGNGQPLVLRGVNHMHTWYKSQTNSYPAIKAAGANAVRVVVSGGRWQPAETTQDIVNIVSLCKANRLICILEDHDTTGFNEDGAAYTLDQAVNFWISVQSALTGQENYVILNIGNEPFGNGSNPPLSAWTTATTNAIQRLRTAGFQHTIMVDGPNWGQDWQFVMRDNAQTVYNADPTGNTILSIHMYGVFPTADVVTSYVDSFVNRGLPLVIGEFGWVDSDEDSGRLGIAAAATGLAQGALDAALGYAQQRETFGQAIIAHQGVAFLLADMEAAVQSARAMTLHAARLKDQGRPFGREAAIAKLVATDNAMRVTTDAVQVLGGIGYSRDMPVERYMREAKVMQIFEGTNQIQRIVISRSVVRDPAGRITTTG
jgi:hypothetical protein